MPLGYARMLTHKHKDALQLRVLEEAMAHPDIFRLSADNRRARPAAESLFERVSGELKAALPATAEVLHVGATAVPGCLTKGDLDIVVRVERKDFQAVEVMLAARFPRTAGSGCTDEFAAFEDDDCKPHLGIQLTVKS